ncbi:calcofluor white hypersensitive protein [Anopheles sinensis]|uniref:Calcofluor white hypersensitive protein n=1 Tax=Anopheles sinensis TaxID=74873 RepID=A0A084W5H7_ANOSI|nr:calcofluor white hypersensitive protein [Anopheles sinensis]
MTNGLCYFTFLHWSQRNPVNSNRSNKQNMNPKPKRPELSTICANPPLPESKLLYLLKIIGSCLR